MVVIDGTDLVLGRLASEVAKMLLRGEDVNLINAEKIIISGKTKPTIEKYMKRRAAQNKAKPEHSPKWPRLPHLLVKKAIRGMLPRKKASGSAALKKLRVYTGNPKNLESAESIERAAFDKKKPFITIEDLCRGLGYTG